MVLRRLLVGLLAGLLAGSLIIAGLPAGAQLPPVPVPTLSPSPIVPSSPEPSPSGQPSPPPEGSVEPPRTEPKPSPSGEVPPPQGSGGSSAPVLTVPQLVRTPARTTARLVEILTPLTDRGVPLEKAMVLTSAPFPVAGYSWFTDDFMFPRYVPEPHLHQGTDIFADFGTPIVASSPGVISAMAITSVGGISLWITSDDGTAFYYSHLLSFAEGLQVGARVDTGSVVGYVGNTGNAITTPPHVHFEIHPPVKDAKGHIVASGVQVNPLGIGQTVTPPANPKPFLDQWLLLAEQRAQAFVDGYVQRLLGLARQIRFSKRVDDLYSVGSGNDGEYLWTSVLEPMVGAVGLAKLNAVSAALAAQGRSSAFRSAEEQRLSAIRLAVQARDVKIGTLFGAFANGGPSTSQ